MADYTAVRDAVMSVQDLLTTHITSSADAGIGGVPIDLRSPRQLEIDTVDGSCRCGSTGSTCSPIASTNLRAALRRPRTPTPAPVDLHLLVTPIVSVASTELLLVGRITQVLFDHRTLSGSALGGVLAATSTELRLAIEQLTAYETNLAWSSLHTHQRPTTAVRVTGLTIDSHLDDLAHQRVLASSSTASELVVGA